MDAELKAKWVAALRSGKYTQGTHVLRSGAERFCCLGVLADLCAPDKWRKTAGDCYAHDDGYFYHETKYGVEEGLIPNVTARHLMGMNDSEQTFAVIADYIEANL